MIKSVIIAALISMTLVSCKYSNRDSAKNPINTEEQTSVYKSINDTIGNMSENILSFIKTDNYASFSNFLSSKDTVLDLLEKQAKQDGISNEKFAPLKQYFDSTYSKLIVTTKKDFDYIRNKGIRQGIIWSDVNYVKTDWTLSKAKDWFGTSSSLTLGLTINFKYKGIDHFIQFDSEAFTLIGSKWLLTKDFYLDSFSPPEQTEQRPNNNDNSTKDSTYTATK